MNLFFLRLQIFKKKSRPRGLYPKLLCDIYWKDCKHQFSRHSIKDVFAFRLATARLSRVLLCTTAAFLAAEPTDFSRRHYEACTSLSGCYMDPANESN